MIYSGKVGNAVINELRKKRMKRHYFLNETLDQKMNYLYGNKKDMRLKGYDTPSGGMNPKDMKLKGY